MMLEIQLNESFSKQNHQEETIALTDEVLSVEQSFS